MSENANTALVRRWFEEFWNQGHLGLIDELIAPDAMAYDFGGPGAHLQGIEAIREAATATRQAFEIHFTIEKIFGAGDDVAVRLKGRFKSIGACGDLPATGRETNVSLMCIITIREGRIVEAWNNWDVALVLRAAGAPADRLTIF